MMMAGLDGIQSQIDPGDPLDKDIYELPAEEFEKIAHRAGRRSRRALDALEADHEFLLQGDVFTAELINAYINYKRENEVDAIRMRPHPWEFALYHDA